jgi:WD40 repeat protein
VLVDWLNLDGFVAALDYCSGLCLLQHHTTQQYRLCFIGFFPKMVLTDRQRDDLHAGIYEYLTSRGDAFAAAAQSFAQVDPKAVTHKTITNNGNGSGMSVGKTPLLEKKWTAIPRLQKKVLELERTVAQNAKIHAHRTGGGDGAITNGGVARRMLPRLPCSHTMQGHSAVVTCIQVHPVFTLVVSGSEDGTIKVSLVFILYTFFNEGRKNGNRNFGTCHLTTCLFVVEKSNWT